MTKHKKLSCIIIDDDPAYLEIVKAMVEKHAGLSCLGEYSDSTEGFNALVSLSPDLVFLDIEMPNMSGLELLSSLKTSIPVILISSKKEYALDAFDFDVIDYIIKPVQYPRFVQAIGKAQRLLSNTGDITKDKPEYIFVKVGSSFKNVAIAEMLYIQAYGDFVKIFTPSGMYTVHSTLKQVEEILPEDDFVKVHRSYVVRIDRISDFNQSNLMIEDKIIPISHRNRKQLLEKLNTL